MRCRCGPAVRNMPWPIVCSQPPPPTTTANPRIGNNCGEVSKRTIHYSIQFRSSHPLLISAVLYCTVKSFSRGRKLARPRAAELEQTTSHLQTRFRVPPDRPATDRTSQVFEASGRSRQRSAAFGGQKEEEEYSRSVVLCPLQSRPVQSSPVQSSPVHRDAKCKGWTAGKMERPPRVKKCVCCPIIEIWKESGIDI